MNRHGYDDVPRVAQVEGSEPVCGILYTPAFVALMDLFRGIVQMDERSERGLALSGEVIEANPANYTAWQYRRLCLYALNSDLAAELDGFVYEMSGTNPKNYQMWHHRRACAERLGEGAAERELAFCAKQVSTDAKNLHAWAHRQWVVSHFQVWGNELAVIDALLDDDVRNNSAWNHRFFVVTNAPKGPSRRSELEFAFAAIRKAPNNESPWSYARGVLLATASVKMMDEDGDNTSVLVDMVDGWAKELAGKFPACVHAASLQLDILEWRAKTSSDAAGEHYKAALAMCDHLASQRDTLHANYWTFRRAQVEEKQLLQG